jgi:glycosyltransferase involved in cell wall biosynthesis
VFATAATGLPYPKVVPVPCDPARYGAALPVHPVRRAFPGDFLFYFIGEAIARKNIGGLAAAFHLAFDPDEPVQLVIKTAVRGLSPPDAEAQVRQSLDQVKRDLGLYPSPDHYKREVVITTPHDDAGLDALHASCDCFASATRGEGWNLPAFDAMAFGKTPVLTDCGAHPDFAGDACRLVDGHRAPVVGMSGVHDNLYHAGQDWVSPDIRDFAAALRHAYDDDAETRRSMAAAGRARVAAFSREAVGAHMRTLLEAAAGGGR